ncbi:MAG: LD-carboxypeptidase [Ferruginibacter sp.]|nr:LD-carboxypeptidase [Ferruginibacter sp.]
MFIIPPYLRRGDCIGITCPAGFMPANKAAKCIETLQSWGFEVMVGKTLGSASENYFSGSDEERRDELQAMMDDDNIHAILFGRGGYGTGRIIDQLNFKKFIKKPKWIIGFSDITILHSHIHRNFKIATIHGPMAGAFNNPTDSGIYIDYLRRTLTGKKITYNCDPHPLNRKGKVRGILVGGNLSLLANAIGTKSDFDTRSKILFIEEIGEFLYSADRMLYQLNRAGKLNNIAGLIVGGFTEMKDTERIFGKNIQQIIKDLIDKYDFPVCFDFPVSHDPKNVSLKIGIEYELSVSKNKTILKEI